VKPPYPEVETEWVQAEDIRAAFNEALVWDKVLSKEYHIAHTRRRPMRSPESSGQPPGTLNEHIWIVDGDGKFVAHAHRFLRTLEPEQLARRPDPKRLVVGDKMLAVLATHRVE